LYVVSNFTLICDPPLPPPPFPTAEPPADLPLASFAAASFFCFAASIGFWFVAPCASSSVQAVVPVTVLTKYLTLVFGSIYGYMHDANKAMRFDGKKQERMCQPLKTFCTKYRT
jgi:hypothetical protein